MRKLVRRGPKELDWQADLAARSVVAQSPPTAVASFGQRQGVLRLKRVFWRTVTPLVVALSLGVLIFGKHHPVGGVLIAFWLCLMPFDWVARRRAKRARKPVRLADKQDPEPTVAERVEFKLKWISNDLRWLLVRPTERSAYDRWLNKATKQLEQISPGVARRWAQPDPGSWSTAETVSATELEARRKRLLELYAEVASPKELARLTADLPQAPSARAITIS